MPTDERRLIFISHHAQDAYVVRKMAGDIRSQGADVFLSEEIEAGDDFAVNIHSALQRADELLILLTPLSLQRAWVFMELGAAWQRELRIVGVLYGVSADDIRRNVDSPITLVQKNLVDINDFDSEYVRQLRRRIVEVV